jgi:uncharacterized protein YjbJ (UPF0337 family)
MSTSDKARNKIDEAAGKAKEKTGQATGDRSLEREGRTDRAKADLKQAGEKAKDAFKK